MIRRPPRSTLFPSTALFRSVRDATDAVALELALIENLARQDLSPIDEARSLRTLIDDLQISQRTLATRLGRSEEHTSELQSRQYLVCRLLLEKKNMHMHDNC